MKLIRRRACQAVRDALGRQAAVALIGAHRTLYCGMTRATVRLDIVANEANPENEALFKRGV